MPPITTDIWSRSGGGNWFAAANWSSGLPGSGQPAAITLAAPGTITFDGTARIAALATNAATTLALAGGALTLAGTGSVLAGALDLSGGAIEVASGLLSLGGGGSLDGALSGAGTLSLGGLATSYELAAGLVLGVAAFDLTATATATLLADLSYAGTLTFGSQGASGPRLALGGHTLTLSGSATFLSGSVTGPGTLMLGSGANGAISALTLSGGAVLADHSWIHQGGSLVLGTSAGDTAGLTIAQGATYSIFQSQITAAGAGDRIVNAGTFGIVSGVDQSSVSAAITSTGTVEVDSGVLGFYGGGDFAGTGPQTMAHLTGRGEIGFFGGQTTLGPDLTLAVSAISIADTGTVVDLGAGETFAGTLDLGAGTKLETGLHALIASGATTLRGTIAGAGVLDITGSATVGAAALTGGAVLLDRGAITQTGALWIGATSRFAARLQIAAGGRYAIANDSGINTGTLGAGGLLNDGTLAKTGGGGTSLIAPATVNDGLIQALGGTLSFAQLLNNGTISAAHGTLALTARLGAAPGQTGLVEIGSQGTLALASGADASQSLLFTATTGTLLLEGAASAPAGSIAGFLAGDIVRLTGMTVTGITQDRVSANLTTVTVQDGGTTLMSLSFAALAANTSLALAADPAGGFDITATTAPVTPALVSGAASPAFAATLPRPSPGPDFQAAWQAAMIAPIVAPAANPPSLPAAEAVFGAAPPPLFAISHYAPGLALPHAAP